MSISNDAHARAMYLKGAGGDLLTFEEECALGLIIQRGLKAKERLDEIFDLEKKLRRVIKKYIGEKAVLLPVVAEGIKAEQVMVERNRKLVASVAMKFVTSLSLEDLLNEGTIGLCQAAKKFDPARNCRFGTYATWWIRQAIQRAIGNTSKTIRHPMHIFGAMRKSYAIKKRLGGELGREPLPAELAGEMNISLEKLAQLEDISAETVLSEGLFEDDDEFSILEALHDRRPGSLSVYERAILVEAIEMVIRSFKPKEQKVIRLRLGIGINAPVTLEKAGGLLKITRERVRQIEKRALEKLRNSKTILAFKKCS